MSSQSKANDSSGLITLSAVACSAEGFLENCHLALVEVVSQQPRDTTDRLPIDLTIAMDRSSSMAGSRIASAIEAVGLIAKRLDERDRLGVIAFDGHVEIVYRPGPVGEAVADKIADVLLKMGLGYGTNLEAGWSKAAELLAAGGLPKAQKTILVLTDGYPSVGQMDASILAAMVGKGYEQGLTTNVVGIGEGFAEGVLAPMAKAGGGIFQFVQFDHDVLALANDPVAGVAGLVANRAALNFEFSDQVGRYEVVHQLPCTFTNGLLAVELGALFAGTDRCVLLEVYGQGDLAELGAVQLSFQDAQGEGGSVERTPVKVSGLGEVSARVGAVLVPLLVSRGLKAIWERGLDQSMAQVNQLTEKLRKDLFGLPGRFRASVEAAQALKQFDEACLMLAEITDDTSVFGKTITSIVSRTDAGIKPSRGWGRR